MSTVFAILGLILFWLVVAGGIVLVTLSFPGTWVIVAAAFVYSLLANFQSPDWQVLLLLVVVAAVAELIEFLVGVLGSRKMQVPTGAIVASVIGGIIGVIVGVPIIIVGPLIGLLLGVFLGAFLYSLITGKAPRQSLQFALHTTFSRALAIFVKTFIAIGMALYLGFQIF